MVADPNYIKRARRGGEASTVGFFGRVYLITERFSLSAKIATKIFSNLTFSLAPINLMILLTFGQDSCNTGVRTKFLNYEKKLIDWVVRKTSICS